MHAHEREMHKRVLISNRGEIAIRIARAAHALGIETVGIFAASDSLALHPRMTTTCVQIPGDSVSAYLDSARIIEAAKAHGADCIHPGYGFLAENAQFAAACAASGIAFVGPAVDTIALFGDKVRARALASSLGIPILPGSAHALASHEKAAAIGQELGFPVMLKAAAGGGGRGMRAVQRAQDMAEAFTRCSSEAKAAFGDGSLFVEKLLVRPRHIEVQVLADCHGCVVHLFERDCSIQLRNQKVVEIAPAPNLDRELRARLLRDAVTLVKGAGYCNAGTVEFLIAPESNEHYFIECNPRIQVEHTITEQITGIDLVEAQFHIAAGASLGSIGLGDQQAIGCRGYAIQARVVAQGPGRITTYKEPSGAGIRVDSSGYSGYEPPPQYDPLFAKLIVTSGANTDFASAVQRTLLALRDFHISGLPTNLGQLQAILSDPSVRAGDARTTLLNDNPALQNGVPIESAAFALFQSQTGSADNGSPSGRAMATPRSLPFADGEQIVRCPMRASVVEVIATVGATVNAGDALLVLSAMKMETPVTAPCAGVVTAMQRFTVGDTVNEGDAMVVVSPGSGTGARTNTVSANWTSVLQEVATLNALAAERLGPGSSEPGVVRQRSRGKLTCRERIELLLDDGSFREVGSIAGFATYDAEGGIEAFTPANSVGGWGKIEGREVVVCADDFTSRGGHADGAIGAKSTYLDRLSIESGIPSIRMLDGSSGGGSVAAMVPQQKREGESRAQESSGAISAGRPRVSGGGGSFLPGHLGSSMYAEQLSKVPVVNLLLGSVVGIGAAKAVLGHFSVMVRDIAQLFVAGPPVVAHAMGYEISKEDLGGWQVHCKNGSVDNLAESEAEAVAMAKRFLSYLPSSVYEAPRRLACSDPVDRREEELFTIVPRRRTTTFDMRRAIALMADVDSFFEIGALWGTDQITGFARFAGYPVGVIASDSRHVNGGALTADGCDKLKRHLDLCDLFHLPVLNLVDNPGFAVGLEHEIAGTIRKGGEWMVAFAQIQVPLFTVLMRRSFGVAGNNFATPRSRPAFRVVWPAADVGGIPPEGGIEAAYKRQLAEAEDPAALRAELNARIESARGPVGPLNRFQMEEMIDPRDTRRYICEWVPTAYRTVEQPARLQSRPLQFRP